MSFKGGAFSPTERNTSEGVCEMVGTEVGFMTRTLVETVVAFLMRASSLRTHCTLHLAGALQRSPRQ